MAETDAKDFSVYFWGVRGSIAVPGPTTQKYGGNTSCVEMRCGPHRLAFDAGTGFRELGCVLRDDNGVDADLFLSHTHLDHVVGLPFFCPVFNGTNRFHAWAGHLAPEMTLREALSRLMCPPLFPVPQEIFNAEIEHHDFTAGDVLSPRPGVIVRTAPLNHPDRATGYRVEYNGRAVCYVTDTEHVPGEPDSNILALIEGADLLIYDSTYTDEEFPDYVGWGHSTWQEGVRLCQAANVKKFALFHHEPERDDRALAAIEASAQNLFPGAFAAREGLEIHL